MNPINNTDNELQKAIDDITKNAGHDKNAGTGAAQELEAKIQNNMGTPPVPENNGLPPMPGARPMGPGRFEDMAMPAPRPGMVNGLRASGQQMGMPQAQRPAQPHPGMAIEVAEVEGGDLGSVREAMMRDLFPLMDMVEMSAEQRYGLYREMLETTGDRSMVPAAYEAVRGIMDDKERAEALLYLLSFTDEK